MVGAVVVACAVVWRAIQVKGDGGSMCSVPGGEVASARGRGLRAMQGVECPGEGVKRPAGVCRGRARRCLRPHTGRQSG